MLWIIIGSFAVLITVAITIYLLPGDSASKKKKREKEQRPSLLSGTLKPGAPDKDWKAIAERWEKNNHGLSGDVEKLKMGERKIAKDLEEAKVSHKELMDKLSLEKSWREKEQVNLEKARHHEKDLKDQIIHTEKDLEKEHSQRLNLERELQDLKVKWEAISAEKRELSTKTLSLESTVKQLSDENRSYKKDNEDLKKKREDIQWVSKLEFDALKKEYNALKQQQGAPG